MTRINHTGHDHPNTTAARTACRKAMKSAPTYTLVSTRGSRVTHAAEGAPDARGYYIIDCGSGLNTVGTHRSAMYRKAVGATELTCRKCVARHS